MIDSINCWRALTTEHFIFGKTRFACRQQYFPCKFPVPCLAEGFTLPVTRGSSRSYAGLSELESINSQFFSLIICASIPFEPKTSRGECSIEDSSGSSQRQSDDLNMVNIMNIAEPSALPGAMANPGSDISPIPRYTRITRHSCRHRRSCREGGDPVRYGLR
jgi:hypothetical protein